MVPSIVSELRTELKGRGVPYPIVYGPEAKTQTVRASSHIAIMRDRQGGDDVEPAPAKSHNPHLIFARWIGVVVRIYAQSRVSGASNADHERIADKVLDQVLVGMRELAAARRTQIRVDGGKLLSAADVEERELQDWPGVIYEQRLAIARGVTDAAYDGEGADELAAGTDFDINATTLDTDASPATDNDLPSAKTRTS